MVGVSDCVEVGDWVEVRVTVGVGVAVLVFVAVAGEVWVGVLEGIKVAVKVGMSTSVAEGITLGSLQATSMIAAVHIMPKKRMDVIIPVLRLLKNIGIKYQS